MLLVCFCPLRSGLSHKTPKKPSYQPCYSMLLIVYCVGVAPISSSGLMAMPSAAGGVVMPTTGTVPLMQPTQGGGVAMAQATPPGPGYVTQQQYYQVQQGSGHAPQQTYSAPPPGAQSRHTLPPPPGVNNYY